MRSGDTHSCRAWRQTIFDRHKSIRFESAFSRYVKNNRGDYVAGNSWLRGQLKAMKLAGSGLFADSADDDIKDYAETMASTVERLLLERKSTAVKEGRQLSAVELVVWLRGLCRKSCVEFPFTEKTAEDEAEMMGRIKAAIRRVAEPTWWRRQLRTNAGRQYEQVAREVGQVSRNAQIYCSNFTLRRRTEQKARNRQLLESIEAENSAGQVYTLAQLSDLSVSNPINRRNELMTRISGFEEYAKRHGDMGIFITLTAPSAYHPMSTRKVGGKFRAFPNTKFNHTTPKEANDYLCRVWANVRSEWDRAGIKTYGFRMVEPHHDGCPHWHAILFLKPEQVREAGAVLKSQALKEDGDEKGAEQNRVKVIPIDPTKGSAAGYCAKYVAKNIDGFGVDADTYGRDAVLSAMRIEAWATTWGIRQFQQIGGASVTVWREARRVRDQAGELEITPEVRAILDACDGGDWDTYTELMGGAICPRDARPLRPMMLARPEPNQFGELVEVVLGLLAGHLPVITRGEAWTLRPISKETRERIVREANAPPQAGVCLAA